MKILKRLIIWLFKIGIDDLPISSQSLSTKEHDIKTAIHEEVGVQHRKALEGVVLPETRQDILTQTNNIPSIERIESHPQETIPEITAISGTEKIPPILSEQTNNAIISTVHPKTRHPIKKEEKILPIEEERPPKRSKVSQEESHLKPVPKRTFRIGIDFGTTTTAVAIKTGKDVLPEALPIGLNGTRYIPSVVYFQPGKGSLEERVLVGEDAEEVNDITRVVRSVKRCFSCKGKGCYEGRENRGFPFPWCQGDGKIHITEEEEITPSKVAYFIIREAIERAIKIVREQRNIDLTTENVQFQPINFGCSANANLEQREIICAIARDLGFKTIKMQNIVEEPILAGFAFTRSVQDPKGRSLIYDFGGGTLDIAIIDVESFKGKPRITVLSTAGENWLGGDDIDTLVYDEFISQISLAEKLDKNKVETKLDSIDRFNLRRLSRSAKEQLSTNVEFSSSLLSSSLGPCNLDLSRQRFEEILNNSGLVKKSLKAVLRALKLIFAFEDAKKSYLSDIQKISKLDLVSAAKLVDRVILVGGVTKTPFIRNKLKKIFGDNKVVEEKVIEPISAVALGATYPRETEHFSISNPPYGFYLEYTDKPNDHMTKGKVILKPFEYYEFHKLWHINSCPVFSKQFDLESDCFNTKLFIRKADEREEDKEPFYEPGKLTAGQWQISIALDGMVFLEKGDNRQKRLDRIPFIHPIQAQIEECRKKLDEGTRNQLEVDLNKSAIDIMNEN